MQVIALCSQKGGSGKTTLAGHLAVQAVRSSGGKVALIDCDPQGSLAAWWNSRNADQPAFAQTTLQTLSSDIEGLRERGFDYVIIDTPPAASAPIVRVMLHSDLVLIPTRPGPHDLRAVRATLDLAERAERPVVFVVNGATPRARITTDAAVALSQYGTVAPSLISQKVIMASSMIDGRTVVETHPSSRSAEEIVTLWDYLAERLTRLANRNAFLGRKPSINGFGRRAFDTGEREGNADAAAGTTASNGRVVAA